MLYTHTITSEHTEILVQTGRLETRVPGGASSIPREQHTILLWQPTSPHIYSGPEGHTDTNNKAGNPYIPRNVTQALIFMPIYFVCYSVPFRFSLPQYGRVNSDITRVSWH